LQWFEEQLDPMEVMTDKINRYVQAGGGPTGEAAVAHSMSLAASGIKNPSIEKRKTPSPEDGTQAEPVETTFKKDSRPGEGKRGVGNDDDVISLFVTEDDLLKDEFSKSVKADMEAKDFGSVRSSRSMGRGSHLGVMVR
jgi:hypothetical protein